MHIKGKKDFTFSDRVSCSPFVVESDLKLILLLTSLILGLQVCTTILGFKVCVWGGLCLMGFEPMALVYAG